MVPTVQAVSKPHHKKVAAVTTPVASPVSVVQVTPTPKPQGDLFTQGADVATKGAGLARLLPF